MQTFSQFCESQIELNEGEMTDAFMRRVNTLSSKAWDKIKKIGTGLEFERKETVFMTKTFFTKLKEILKDEKSITDEDVKRAVKQLGDIGKFSLIAPLFMLPGGGTTTAVLYTLGKRLFGISILPQGLEQVFEMVYDVKETIKQIDESGIITMKDFQQYLAENKTQIDESTLSRVYQHFNSDRTLGLMSAFRGDYTLEENIKRNRQLAKSVRAAGYGFIWVDGAWVENEGTPEEEHVSEVSLLIVGQEGQDDLREHMVKWAKQYDQDAVVFKPTTDKKIAYLLDKNDKVLETFKNQKFDKVAQVYTKLRRGTHAGRTFILEGARNRTTFASALDEASLSRIWKQVQEHQAGAITGYRGENTKAQNKQNNKEILAYLKNKGYSVISVKGSYIENFGSDTQREVGEPSFFVIDIKDTGNLQRDLAALGRRYDQDSVLVVPKGGKGAFLLGTSKREDAFPDFGKTVTVGNAKFGRAAGEFLSRVRGREFAFESEEVEFPGTINGKRGWSILAGQVEEQLDFE